MCHIIINVFEVATVTKNLSQDTCSSSWINVRETFYTKNNVTIRESCIVMLHTGNLQL